MVGLASASICIYWPLHYNHKSMGSTSKRKYSDSSAKPFDGKNDGDSLFGALAAGRGDTLVLCHGRILIGRVGPSRVDTLGTLNYSSVLRPLIQPTNQTKVYSRVA